MNKSVMKCCICNNENIGKFITINDKKYHLCCIEQLQQQNQKYKEVIKKIIEYLQSKKFEENFPYEANEWQVRGSIINIVAGRIMTEDFNELLDILKEVE